MNEQKLINLIGEIGRLLLKYGAEIYRVEESTLNSSQRRRIFIKNVQKLWLSKC